MSIAIVCLVTLLVIIVFAIVPKRFALVEMVFIYFVSSILTVTIFTILDINLDWVPASRDVEKSLALHICRFVEIPLLLIMSSDISNSHLQTRSRWTIAAVICLFLTINDQILLWLGILVYNKWNALFAFIDYGLFIAVMAWIARWFVHLKEKELKKHDNI